MKFNLLRIIGKIIYSLVILFLIVTASGIVFAYFDIPGGLKLYTVQSGSMEPAIKTGSLVINRAADNYQTGDIITYKAEKDRDIHNPRYTTTHRIINIKEEDGTIFYETQGDANEAPDIEFVARDLVLGKTVLSIPYLGYPINFAKSRDGLIFLIVIPSTLIVYTELMNIKNETKKLLEKRKKEKLSVRTEIKSNFTNLLQRSSKRNKPNTKAKNQKKINKNQAAALILLVGFLAAYAGLTRAYFTDRFSISNTITAGFWENSGSENNSTAEADNSSDDNLDESLTKDSTNSVSTKPSATPSAEPSATPSAEPSSTPTPKTPPTPSTSPTPSPETSPTPSPTPASSANPTPTPQDE